MQKSQRHPENVSDKGFPAFDREKYSVYGMHENPWVKTLATSKKSNVPSLKTMKYQSHAPEKIAPKILFDRFSVLSMIDRKPGNHP